MQIAIYGKGGIGKSTVSANLSAALAVLGSRVLQIGCDPKHDSTRLLHHGQPVRTVLEYLLNTPEEEQRLDAVLMQGYLGTGCVEAGGPRPGMGCAGRGILTAFEFLNRFHAREGYEYIVYDVLGDVVCGGFAVPVRRQYADAVFLVTSGEAMAIYAANNILQGIRNLDQDECRIAGIIYNSRGVGDESYRVYAFAEAVGLPVCVRIPRSDRFAQAERAAVTVVEQDPEGTEAGLFLQLAGQITDGLQLYPARPLDETQMERFMRGEAIRRAEAEPISKERLSQSTTVLQIERAELPMGVPNGRICKKTVEAAVREGAAGCANEKKGVLQSAILPKKRALSDPFSRVPLFGCAFNGAVALAIHVKDAAVLAHAPKSCVWFSQNGFTAYARRGFFERGILYPAFIPQQFTATDITMQDAVFGGVEHARQKALALVKNGAKAIIAVTACIPGMSGDDLEPLKEELRMLGCEMYIIHTDGVEAGDYNEGMALCYKTLAKEAVKKEVQPEADCINLVYEQTWSSATDRNYEVIKALLASLGIRVNCRFLCASSIEEIHGFLRAPYSMMARTDALGQEIRHIFEKDYGCRFLEGGFPKGFRETRAWMETLGTLYRKETLAREQICLAEQEYEREIENAKRWFAKKRTLIFVTGPDQNWLPELVDALELEVVYARMVGKMGDDNPGWNRRFSADWETDREAVQRAIGELKPELLILDDRSAVSDIPEGTRVLDVPRELIPGFFTGIHCAGKWQKELYTDMEGRWKHDRSIFEKYYGGLHNRSSIRE